MTRTTETIRVEHIAVDPARRPVDPGAVDRLAESIKALGLRTPITVRIVDGFVDEDGVVVDGQPILVTSAHRLAAAKQLGMERIECFIFDDDDQLEARLWEISENLHRSELSTAERLFHVAEWERLSASLISPNGSGKSESNPKSAGRKRTTKAIADALGVSDDTVLNARKADSLTDEAKAVAVEENLGVREILAVAKAPKEEQAAAAREIARQKAEPKAKADSNVAPEVLQDTMFRHNLRLSWLGAARDAKRGIAALANTNADPRQCFDGERLDDYEHRAAREVCSWLLDDDELRRFREKLAELRAVLEVQP